MQPKWEKCGSIDLFKFQSTIIGLVEDHTDKSFYAYLGHNDKFLGKFYNKKNARAAVKQAAIKWFADLGFVPEEKPCANLIFRYHGIRNTLGGKNGK